ncbi:tetratricopeptide repeat protein [Alcanivorax hongdengensis]|uniref:tetratricopeptide repeat protein n=1 Tax=Alcanivorax hongdengensis TaxID=519051 RepID=UPI0002ED46F6|nr:tetratricopeptide repeat protein [Alcanivorax hongdengensis]
MIRRSLVALLFGVSVAHAQSEPPRPYVAPYYERSYAVFVGAGNLQRARQVAESALYWRHDDADWWRRYAQVCLWQGDTEAALEGWRRVAELTDDPQAWKEVLALAPLTYNDTLALTVYQRLLRGSPRDEKLIDTIAEQYELLGKPDQGVDFLHDWYQRYPGRAVLLALQRLSLHQRKDLQAHHYLRAYMDRYGAQPDMALQSAQLLWIQGQREQAYRELRADMETLDYRADLVRLRAVMASELGDWPVAASSYQQLVDHDDDQLNDLYQYLVITRYFKPDNLATLMERAWQRSGNPDFAVSALYSMQDGKQWQAMEDFVAGLSPEQRARLEKQPEFLRLYAGMLQRRGDTVRARRALEKALHLAPADRETRIAWLWLLIDSNDRRRLQATLQRWEPASRMDRRYWEVLAAAHMALDQPETALRYERRLYQESPDQWRRQWAYGQALLAAGRDQQAWPILYRLWQQLPIAVSADQAAFYQDMKLALSLRFDSGDASLQQVRETLADSDLSEADKAALVGQWAQGQDAPELARAWYLKQKRAGRSWAAGTALANAMMANDIDRIGQLVTDKGADLTEGERIESWVMLDEPRRAAQLLAQQQTDAPELAGANNQQESLLLPAETATRLVTDKYRQGPLDTMHSRLEQRWAVSDHSHLSLDLVRNRFQADDYQQLLVNDLERRAGLIFAHDRERSSQQLYVGQRDIMNKQQTMARLSLTASPLARWSAGLDYNWNMPADENSLLILGASRSGPQLSLSWSPSPTWQSSVEGSAYSYQDLNDQSLGDGRIINVQSTWRPWLSRFSPGLRVTGTNADFSPEITRSAVFKVLPRGANAAQNALPESYRQQELVLLLGHPDVHIRPHRLQGWLEAGYSHNSLVGNGLVARGAVEGPLLGRDAWQLFMERQLNTGGSDEDSYRFGLQYVFYY